MVLKLETIHVLDHDFGRRAAIARTALGFGHHTELYEGLPELAGRPPRSGLLLAFDDLTHAVLPEVFEILEGSGGYLPVAMYSNEISAERIVAAMRSGALDYLEWPLETRTLERSFERLRTAGVALVAEKRKVASARRLVEELTGREREVLRALMNGGSSKNIAEALEISPRTVEVHRTNLMKKLNVSNAIDAVRIGLVAGEDS